MPKDLIQNGQKWPPAKVHKIHTSDRGALWASKSGGGFAASARRATLPFFKVKIRSRS